MLGKQTYPGQAAVLILLDESESHILLTKRSASMSSHAGEVAFPGGMWESSDENLRETALRESEEEVGLNRQGVDVIAELPVCNTRQGVVVKPYIAKAKAPLRLEPSPRELESLFWFPLGVLLQDDRVATDLFQRGRTEFWAPVYEFDGYKVWGFTAGVLVNFAKQHYQVKISKSHTAPERRHSV